MHVDKNELEDASQAWVDDEVIDAEQREEILSRYEDDSGIPRQGLKAVAGFGGVMLFVGVLGLIGVYWDALGFPGQLAVLFGCSGLFIGSAYYIREEISYPNAETVLVFAGILFMIGGLLQTYAWLDLAFSQFHIVLLGSLIALPLSIYFESRLSLLVSLMGGAYWIVEVGQIGPGAEQTHLALLFYGLILYGLSTRPVQFRGLLQWVGAFFILGILVVTVVFPRGLVMSAYSVPFGLFGLVALGVTGYIVYRNREADEREYESVWMVGVLIAGIYFLMLSQSEIGFIGAYEDLFWMVHNLGYLAFVIGAGATAYQRRSTALLNVALVFFILHISYVYYEMVFEVVGFIALIIGGIILIGGSIILEKKRRQLIDEW